MATEPEWTTADLRKLRRALGFTQSKFGDRIRVSSSRISSWETGRAERIGGRYFEALRELRTELGTKLDVVEKLTRGFMGRHVREGEGSIDVREIASGVADNFERLSDMEFVFRHMDMILRKIGLEVTVAYPREIKGLVLHRTASRDPPPTPQAAAGPDYASINGKLRLDAHNPTTEEAESQQRLHERLASKSKQLLATLAHAGNQYAELVRAVEEYIEIISNPLGDLDVTGLWSVGGSLHALMTSYKNQDALSLAPPLEPQMAAALTSLVRDHGAFILGFKEGQVLVDRADKFLLESDIVADVEESAKELLHELATNADLVEEHTRKIHITVEDALHKADWGTTRVTYTAYAIVRNAFRAIVRHSVGRELNLSTVGGAVGFLGLAAGDPSLEFARTAIPVLLQYSSQLLSFCAHSPELRSYVEWALATLEKEKAVSR